jgi:D-alanyl-D-alanine carboxypeptidase
MLKKFLYSIVAILGVITISGCAVLALSAPSPQVAVVLPQTQQAQAMQPIMDDVEEPAPLPNASITTGSDALQSTSNPCPQPTKVYPDYSYLDVGQDIPIPDKNYIPSDLTLLDTSISTSSICLKKDAALAVTKMISDAKAQGYDIKVSSGFRSYNTQEGILSRDIASGNPDATKLVAKPGYSEHQLGMAVDLTSGSIADASAAVKFGDTKEFTWLQNHAYQYGFIQSYPEGKEDITGYMNEAWHYRYVGVDDAALIVKNGETTNQFLKQLDGTTTVVENFIQKLVQ